MNEADSTTKPKRNGALVTLWVAGPALIVGGLIARYYLVEDARSDYQVGAMWDDLTGSTSNASGPDYATANLALWAVGLGVVLVVAAIVIQAARRR